MKHRSELLLLLLILADAPAATAPASCCPADVPLCLTDVPSFLMVCFCIRSSFFSCYYSLCFHVLSCCSFFICSILIFHLLSIFLFFLPCAFRSAPIRSNGNRHGSRNGDGDTHPQQRGTTRQRQRTETHEQRGQQRGTGGRQKQTTRRQRDREPARRGKCYCVKRLSKSGQLRLAVRTLRRHHNVDQHVQSIVSPSRNHLC